MDVSKLQQQTSTEGESINDSKEGSTVGSDDDEVDVASKTESEVAKASTTTTTPPPINLNVYIPEVKRLSDSELYVLCICLCIIRRERDLIMANRFDATDILKVGVFYLFF